MGNCCSLSKSHRSILLLGNHEEEKAKIFKILCEREILKNNLNSMDSFSFSGRIYNLTYVVDESNLRNAMCTHADHSDGIIFVLKSGDINMYLEMLAQKIQDKKIRIYFEGDELSRAEILKKLQVYMSMHNFSFVSETADGWYEKTTENGIYDFIEKIE